MQGHAGCWSTAKSPEIGSKFGCTPWPFLYLCFHPPFHPCFLRFWIFNSLILRHTSTGRLLRPCSCADKFPTSRKNVVLYVKLDPKFVETGIVKEWHPVFPSAEFLPFTFVQFTSKLTAIMTKSPIQNGHNTLTDMMILFGESLYSNPCEIVQGMIVVWLSPSIQCHIMFVWWGLPQQRVIGHSICVEQRIWFLQFHRVGVRFGWSHRTRCPFCGSFPDNSSMQNHNPGKLSICCKFLTKFTWHQLSQSQRLINFHFLLFLETFYSSFVLWTSIFTSSEWKQSKSSRQYWLFLIKFCDGTEKNLFSFWYWDLLCPFKYRVDVDTTFNHFQYSDFLKF